MDTTDDESRLRDVFAAYDWDFNQYLKIASSFDHPRLLNGEGNNAGGRIDAIHVTKWERFGNSVVQLVNIAALSQKYGIPIVYFEDEHQIFDVSRLSLTTGIPFTRKQRREFAPQDGAILSAVFFFDQPYRLFSGRERQVWMDNHVLPLLPPEFSADHPRVTDDSITAHFRAGDIFSTQIHRGYGQPPLEYYKMAVAASDAQKVIVVYEDLGNPMIEPFIDHIRATGRLVVAQSSDLGSDLALLFSSRELVSGRGSFLWAIHALSRKLKRFWYFHRPWDESPLARKDIRVNCIHDQRGDYIKSIYRAGWKNTEEQRTLMLTYPAAALSCDVING